MEFSSTDLTTILQESLKVQVHKNELENYASKIIIATSHRGQYKIRPCNLVNYMVEVHNKTIHFFLSLSLSVSLIHTPKHVRAHTQACTHHHHCHCHCRQMDWSHLLTRSRSQNQRSRSLSDSLSDSPESELSESEKEFLDHFGSGPSGNDKTRCYKWQLHLW